MNRRREIWGRYGRSTHLVGAAEDVDDTRHVELLCEHINVHAHVAQLSRLHREGRVGPRRAGGAALRVVDEDRLELGHVAGEVGEDGLTGVGREQGRVREERCVARGAMWFDQSLLSGLDEEEARC